MLPIRIKACSESDLRMLGNLARNIQRVLPVTQADIDAAAALGKGWVVWKVVEVNDPIDNLRGGTQLVIKQNSITPGQNVRRVLIVSGPGGETVVIGPGPSPLLLPDAIADSLTYVKAFGGTEQNETPTPDAPVDIVSNNGAIKFSPNELNPSDIEIGYYRVAGTGELTESPYNFITGFMPVKPGQSYVFFGRRQDDNRLSSYNRIHWFDANKEFISTNSYTKDVIGTGVAPSNAYFAQCSCNESGATSRVTTQEVVDGYNWVFQQGTAEVPYVPYVDGGLYTDGTVETINMHGKNLNGGGALDNKGYTSTGGTSTLTTFCGTLWKIKCKEGEKYTVSFGNFPDGISGVFINTWLTDGTWNLRQAISISGDYTYTIPAGVGEVNFTLYKTGGITIADNSWLQVEKGETATDYEPYYDGGTATAEMLLSVGDYTDEQEILSGAVTRKVGVKVLDGTENVGTSNATFTIAISDRISSKTPLICSHFQYSNKTSSQTEDLTIISFSSTNIGFRYDACADATAFKTWLANQYAAGTPVIVVYPQATPTTESVAGQTLQVTDGANTLTITQAGMNGLQLEAEYEKVA